MMNSDFYTNELVRSVIKVKPVLFFIIRFTQSGY